MIFQASGRPMRSSLRNGLCMGSAPVASVQVRSTVSTSATPSATSPTAALSHGMSRVFRM